MLLQSTNIFIDFIELPLIVCVDRLVYDIAILQLLAYCN